LLIFPLFVKELALKMILSIKKDRVKDTTYYLKMLSIRIFSMIYIKNWMFVKNKKTEHALMFCAVVTAE